MNICILIIPIYKFSDLTVTACTGRLHSPSYEIILIVGLSAIKSKYLMIGAFYTTRDTLQWQ